MIDKANTIIAGHGRVEAAKLLQMESVPAICLENLTPAQVRAYVIADKRLAEDAGWDPEILKIELQHLVIENEIDISLTGFETSEIDLILNPLHTEADPANDFPDEVLQLTTEPGDLWSLGGHRIFCGDAREESYFTTLMQDRRAAVVFADPPYNVVIDGHASGNGKVHHSEFAMASGEMDEAQFIKFLTDALLQLSTWSLNGSVHFLCMDWRHMPELLAAGKSAYDSLLNVCVWAKDNGGMGSFYRSQHEMIFVFKNGKGTHRNNIQLGKFGRNRTNVWRYTVLSLANITPHGPRIFISYRQKDSASLAIQLFDALSHAGFEAFLDHFRIPPGVNFQAKLTQELGDKAMVLVIESEHLLESDWVKHEINVAKVNSLGVFALHAPRGEEVDGIDSSYRHFLSDSNFVSNAFTVNAILRDDVLADVVERMKIEHDRALIRRRQILRDSLEGALASEGVAVAPLTPQGIVPVTAKDGTQYFVWLTPRPPELLDFHTVHGVTASPAKGVIVGLSRLMEPVHFEQTNWLAGLTSITMVEEGQLRKAATQMAQGAL